MRLVKILAVDPGEKRTGLAAGDELGITTRLLPVLRVSPSEAAKAVVDLVRQEAFGAVLIGLPLNMDGSEGQAAKNARAFAERVEKALQRAMLKTQVLLWDERLTSFEAESRLRERGISKAKAKDFLDSVAAEVLLEDYLLSQGERK